MIRIGDEAIATEDDAKLRTYFADDYVFHGPGRDLSYEELRAYFESLRTAFSGLRIVREQIIVDGTPRSRVPRSPATSPRFLRESPIGPVGPTGQHVVWELIGTFRYNNAGRLAEEWVQTDYRSSVTKLGIAVTESV